MFHTDRRVRLEFPGAVSGQAHGSLRPPVVAVAQADHVGITGELARDRIATSLASLPEFVK